MIRSSQLHTGCKQRQQQREGGDGEEHRPALPLEEESGDHGPKRVGSYNAEAENDDPQRALIGDRDRSGRAADGVEATGNEIESAIGQ
jgi:hypothetical protein